jgi:uncharacterized protein (DUF1330 family)
MPYVIGRNKVKDFETWKAGFSSSDSVAMRKAAGAKSWRIFRTADDPNTFFVLIEFDSLDNARKYYGSQEWKGKQPSVGVIGQPEIYYVEEV